MNNYLLQLLKEVKTLIIPGLGALTVTNEATGEILFMPYLKFDDGTLANHIANKESMDPNDAKNMISKFVREVTAELDKGNSYDMYQFGRFVKVDGEIAFEAWTAANTEEQKPAEAPVKPEPVVEAPSPVIEPVKEEPKKEEPKVEIPPVTEEPKKSEEPQIKVENLKVEEAKIIPPASEKTEPKIAEKPLPKKEEKAPLSKTEVSSDKDEKPKESVKPVAQKESEKKAGKEAKAPKEKKKSPVLSYILWGFLVLILGSGTFIAIRFDSLKKDFPILADLAGENDDVAKGSEEVKQLEEDPDASTDSIESEPIPEDEVQVVEDQLPEPTKEQPKKETPKPVKETPAPIQTSTPKKQVVETKKKTAPKKTVTSGTAATFDGSKHFHVIAGSFGSEANANRLAGKLQSKGFAEASVTMNGGMYRVSVKGFATLNEATAEAANIQSSVPGAWVLKM